MYATLLWTSLRFPRIDKPLVVYRFYCMALFHSQTRRHMINAFILLTIKLHNPLLILTFDSDPTCIINKRKSHLLFFVPDPPAIAIPIPRIGQYSNRNKEATLECRVEANRPAKVSWKRHGRPILHGFSKYRLFQKVRRYGKVRRTSYCGHCFKNS